MYVNAEVKENTTLLFIYNEKCWLFKVEKILIMGHWQYWG